MSKKQSKVKSKVPVDIIGFTANALINTTRFILRCTRTDSNDEAHRIMLAWKRGKVCVETLERGEEYVIKEYPRLVWSGVQGHNKVFKYRIPTGLSYSKVRESLDNIEFDLKSEVLFKLLENEKAAHFSLKILSGKLIDLIHFTNEAGVEPEGKSLKRGLWVPLGWSRRGLEQLDLASSNSPHLLIGGATGGGKSILGRLILACLHIRYTRKECRLWLCDLKHGNGTSLLGPSPLLVDRSISSPDEVEGMMDDLSRIIGERYRLFRDCGCDDLAAYNEEYPDRALYRIVVYLDEMTKLEGKEYTRTREKLTKVTGESRGAGVHLIASCHRPTANLISGTMKNNIPAVVAFRCNATSARVLLGEDKGDYMAANAIDPDVEGRALFKFKDEVLIQVPFITNKHIKEIMADYQRPEKAAKTGAEKVIVLSTR